MAAVDTNPPSTTTGDRKALPDDSSPAGLSHQQRSSPPHLFTNGSHHWCLPNKTGDRSSESQDGSTDATFPVGMTSSSSPAQLTSESREYRKHHQNAPAKLQSHSIQQLLLRPTQLRQSFDDVKAVSGCYDAVCQPKLELLTASDNNSLSPRSLASSADSNMEGNEHFFNNGTNWPKISDADEEKSQGRKRPLNSNEATCFDFAISGCLRGKAEAAKRARVENIINSIQGGSPPSPQSPSCDSAIILAEDNLDLAATKTAVTPVGRTGSRTSSDEKADEQMSEVVGSRSGSEQRRGRRKQHFPQQQLYRVDFESVPDHFEQSQYFLNRNEREHGNEFLCGSDEGNQDRDNAGDDNDDDNDDEVAKVSKSDDELDDDEQVVMREGLIQVQRRLDDMRRKLFGLVIGAVATNGRSGSPGHAEDVDVETDENLEDTSADETGEVEQPTGSDTGKTAEMDSTTPSTAAWIMSDVNRNEIQTAGRRQPLGVGKEQLEGGNNNTGNDWNQDKAGKSGTSGNQLELDRLAAILKEEISGSVSSLIDDIVRTFIVRKFQLRSSNRVNCNRKASTASPKRESSHRQKQKSDEVSEREYPSVRRQTDADNSQVRQSNQQKRHGHSSFFTDEISSDWKRQNIANYVEEDESELDERSHETSGRVPSPLPLFQHQTSKDNGESMRQAAAKLVEYRQALAAAAYLDSAFVVPSARSAAAAAAAAAGLHGGLVRSNSSEYLSPSQRYQNPIGSLSYSKEPEQTEALPLVVSTPRKKRTKVTDTRLSPRAARALLQESLQQQQQLLGSGTGLALSQLQLYTQHQLLYQYQQHQLMQSQKNDSCQSPPCAPQDMLPSYESRRSQHLDHLQKEHHPHHHQQTTSVNSECNQSKHHRHHGGHRNHQHHLDTPTPSHQHLQALQRSSHNHVTNQQYNCLDEPDLERRHISTSGDEAEPEMTSTPPATSTASSRFLPFQQPSHHHQHSSSRTCPLDGDYTAADRRTGTYPMFPGTTTQPSSPPLHDSSPIQMPTAPLPHHGHTGGLLVGAGPAGLLPSATAPHPQYSDASSSLLKHHLRAFYAAAAAAAAASAATRDGISASGACRDITMTSHGGRGHQQRLPGSHHMIGFQPPPAIPSDGSDRHCYANVTGPASTAGGAFFTPHSMGGRLIGKHGEAIPSAAPFDHFLRNLDAPTAGSYDGIAVTSTLTPMHLRKAKLMFFYVRYPSSSVLKEYFPDVRFNKNNTAQLVKWFSNFREFFYIQMEKYARQALADGVKSTNELMVSNDSEIYRVLVLHYNRNNQIEVPEGFRFAVQAALREFYASIAAEKDQEQSWKKAIYKVIARLDEPVPDYFKTANWLEQLADC